MYKIFLASWTQILAQKSATTLCLRTVRDACVRTNLGTFPGIVNRPKCRLPGRCLQGSGWGSTYNVTPVQCGQTVLAAAFIFLDTHVHVVGAVCDPKH